MDSEATPAGREWPTRCDMPDLSELSSATSLTLALNRMFLGGGPKDSTPYALLMNFNRVVDILIEDYQSARRALIEDYQSARRALTAATRPTGGLPLRSLNRAIGHFENCITTALRAIRFAQRLRKKSNGVIPTKAAVLAGGVEKRIREMRNAIEHLDEELVSRDWKQGDAYCLMVGNDRIELAGQAIRYSELAAWITDLHGMATKTALHREAGPAEGE